MNIEHVTKRIQDVLAGVSDLFDSKIKRQDGDDKRVKVVVSLFPKLDESRFSDGVGDVYQRWYAPEEGVMLELDLYLLSHGLYLRVVNAPVAQSTKKRHFEDVMDAEAMRTGLRGFLLGMLREWKEVAKTRSLEDQCQWAVGLLAHNSGQEQGFDPNAPKASVVVVRKMVKVYPDKALKQKVASTVWEVEPTSVVDEVDVAVTINLKGLDKDRLAALWIAISAVNHAVK